MVKALGAVAAVALAVALLVVLSAAARHRGKLTHCRNNLRHLGNLATKNWEFLDRARSGRDFWQGVREVEYRTIRGEWKPIHPDPFVCPVYGKTVSRREDSAAIDYRGPRAVRPSAGDTPREEPLGADRPGNHPAGGYVLRADGSVTEAVRDSASPWAEAEGALRD